MVTEINEKHLDEKFAELEVARSWSPRTISKLESLIRDSDESRLFRINPVQFGIEKNIPEEEAIDLFLHGARIGLFEMGWHLLCSMCGDVVESLASLKAVHSHFHCTICQLDYDATLDNHIEISFTIRPEIREIAFHNPEQLPIEDYFFKYVFRQGALKPDGNQVIETMKDTIKLITYLEPNEKRAFKLEIPRSGILAGCDQENRAELALEIKGKSTSETKHFSFKVFEGRIESGHGEIPPGKHVLEFENKSGKKSALLLTHIPSDYIPSGQVQFLPFLSGKKLLNIQTFRDRFRSEIIRGNDGIGVKEVTILFTDLKGSTALYDRIGDLQAFSLVHQHFDSLKGVINSHSGAIVKTIGDAIMATFLNPADALKTAFAMLDELQRFNQGLQNEEIIIKIGIHRGPSIAVTLNERLDYFGQTVNIASRVQELADAKEIFITRDVYSSPGVQEILKDCSIDSETAKLKGVQEEMIVYMLKP